MKRDNWEKKGLPRRERGVRGRVGGIRVVWMGGKKEKKVPEDDNQGRFAVGVETPGLV